MVNKLIYINISKTGSSVLKSKSGISDITISNIIVAPKDIAHNTNAEKTSPPLMIVEESGIKLYARMNNAK